MGFSMFFIVIIKRIYAETLRFVRKSQSSRCILHEMQNLGAISAPISHSCSIIFLPLIFTGSNINYETINLIVFFAVFAICLFFIYSGKIMNWSEVGGGNDEIRAYLRAKNSGSQTMLEEIMGGIPLFAAPEEDYLDMMKEMYMAVAYKEYRNALGFSFRYYIGDMIGENKVKFLSIESVYPTKENIADGTYPFALDYYAITVEKEPMSERDRARIENAEKFIEWILSPQGQALTEKTGYIPLY